MTLARGCRAVLALAALAGMGCAGGDESSRATCEERGIDARSGPTGMCRHRDGRHFAVAHVGEALRMRLATVRVTAPPRRIRLGGAKERPSVLAVPVHLRSRAGRPIDVVVGALSVEGRTFPAYEPGGVPGARDGLGFLAPGGAAMGIVAFDVPRRLDRLLRRPGNGVEVRVLERRAGRLADVGDTGFVRLAP